MRENHHVCQNNEPKAMCVNLLIGCICVSVGDLCTDALTKSVQNMGKTFCFIGVLEAFANSSHRDQEFTSFPGQAVGLLQPCHR